MSRLGFGASLAIAFALSAAAQMAHAQAVHPAFDCEKATTPTEQFICHDKELATLDVEVATAYAAAMSRAPAAQILQLRTTQETFLRMRNRCAVVSDTRNCLLDAYRDRLNALK